MVTHSAPSAIHARCRAAIAGQPVDRAPAYLPGIACAVASELLGRPIHAGTGSLHYAEACAWMGGEAAHADFEEQLFADLADLYRALEIDVYRMPWRMTEKPALQVDAYTFVYGDPQGAYTAFRYNPESGDFGPVESVIPPSSLTYEDQVRAQVEAQEARLAAGELERTSVATEHRLICERFGSEFFVVCNGGGISVGYGEESLMLMLTDPELMRRNIAIQARHAAAAGRVLAREGYPGVLIAGGDMAGNDGPFYSPASFRQVLLPPLVELMRELRACGVHYVFRSDGNLWPVAEMLFGEAGCPGFGEVDRDAGMSTGALRQRFPSLVLWGNMSVNKLAAMPASWVREEARRMIEESGGTGYFHGPSNAIMKGTPVENVLALFAER
ncbi:MAG: uroporphyrinogen decarboxylase family protein [Armatimonadota bacterium]